MNIVLIGYRCSGKTVVGRTVAERLNRGFVDADSYLEEKAGRSIESIVAEKGWEFFRELEKAVIKDLSARNDQVIATGGGVVTHEENVKHLRANGFVIWLQAEADILSARMDNDLKEGKNRPSLTGKDPVKEIRMVLDQRAPLYQKASDRVIDTGRLSLSETVERVIRLFQHQ